MERQDTDTDIDCYEVLNALDQPVAVVDLRSKRILWSSTTMEQLLPTAMIGVYWRDALEQQPELEQCYIKLCSSDMSRRTLPFDTDEVSGDFTIQNLGKSKQLIHIQPSISVADQMRQYMQARDLLFSTSRTISVSEMATTLAHEINQPIGTIVNLLKGIKSRIGKTDVSVEQIQQALDRALDQAMFTSNIVARIRDFTQSRRPRQQLLDVRHIVSEAMELLDWLFSTNGCKTRLTLSDEPLLVRGDATMLQQVLVNLLRNAVDAMQNEEVSKRTLLVEANCNGQRITVSIRDSGHGLFGQEDSLYIPFVTNKENGMGVGLNICRSFVELHQGRLWLSPNDNHGCTASIELPMARDTSKIGLKEVGNA